MIKKYLQFLNESDDEDIDPYGEENWNDKLPTDEDDEDYDPTPTPSEIKEFLSEWGQSNDEITSNLGYDEEGSDDLLVDDYFWFEETEQWYPKDCSSYSEREQEIADYLRNH